MSDMTFLYDYRNPPPYNSSSGLHTSGAIACSTWVYTMVVSTLLCPSRSCTRRSQNYADEFHVEELSALFRDYLEELNPDHPLLEDTTSALDEEIQSVFDLSSSEKLVRVVLVEGQIAGFAVCLLVDDRQSMMIQEFYVKPDDRRSGLARATFDSLQSEAREMGVANFGMQVWGRNRDAVAFWQALGFEISNYLMARSV